MEPELISSMNFPGFYAAVIIDTNPVGAGGFVDRVDLVVVALHHRTEKKFGRLFRLIIFLRRFLFVRGDCKKIVSIVIRFFRPFATQNRCGREKIERPFRRLVTPYCNDFVPVIGRLSRPRSIRIRIAVPDSSA